MASCTDGRASDLEVTIRPHANRVIFADPLYVEVTIVNRGKEPISLLPASMDLGTFGFHVYDSERQLTMAAAQTGGAWGAKAIQYAPDKAFKHYFRVFLPSLFRCDHDFWKPLRSGRGIEFSGRYALRRGLTLGSNSEHIVVERRDNSELQALEDWSKRENEGFGKGPIPNDLGLQFKSGLNRQQTTELAERVPSGEIHDLLLIAIQLRDIYDTPADSRDAKNRGLVEWLKKLPDIKRQCLITEVRDVAEGHQLTSTAEAVKQLIDWK